MMRLFRRNNNKKTGFGAEEPPEINWFAIVLLFAAGALLCLMLYALLAPVLLGDEPAFEIVPYQSTEETTFTPPPPSTLAPTSTPAPQPTITGTPAPVYPVSINTVLQIAKIAELQGIGAEVSSVAISPDGRYVGGGSYNGTISVWDRTTLQITHRFESTSNRVNSIAFSPDGTRIVAGGQDTVVRLWSLASNAETLLDGPTAAVRSVAFSPDGARVAAGSDDGVIYVWNANTDPPVLERLLSGHTSYVTSVAFSPSGETIAAGGEDDSIRLWSMETGNPRGVLEGHSSTVTSIAFSPDGTRLASTSADKTVRLWNLLTQSADAVMNGHTENVNDVAFSPDGSLLVSTGSGINDNAARFWDARTGLEVRNRLVLPGPANAVAFSPDGRTMATGGATYLVLWGVPEGAPVAAPPGAPTSPAVAAIPTTTPAQGIAQLDGQGGALLCTLTVRQSRATAYTGPDEDFQVARTLAQSDTVQAAGWATGEDSYTWWQLTDSSWVRGDAFISTASPTLPTECLQLPPVNTTTGAPVATTVPAAPAASDSTVCTLTVRAAEATLYGGPGEDYAAAGTLTQGQNVQATSWTTGVDSYTWWVLSNGTWARGDAFISVSFPTLPDACLSLQPVSEAPAAPAAQTTTGAQPAAQPAATTCTLTARKADGNLRGGPGTSYQIMGTLTTGQTVQATGWATGSDQYTWWRLNNNFWARGDIFVDSANPVLPTACLSLPQVEAP